MKYVTRKVCNENQVNSLSSKSKPGKIRGQTSNKYLKQLTENKKIMPEKQFEANTQTLKTQWEFCEHVDISMRK